jgi:hypothetical protein
MNRFGSAFNRHHRPRVGGMTTGRLLGLTSTDTRSVQTGAANSDAAQNLRKPFCGQPQIFDTPGLWWSDARQQSCRRDHRPGAVWLFRTHSSRDRLAPTGTCDCGDTCQTSPTNSARSRSQSPARTPLPIGHLARSLMIARCSRTA